MTVYVMDVDAIADDMFEEEASTGVSFVISSLNETMGSCGLWKGLAGIEQDYFMVRATRMPRTGPQGEAFGTESWTLRH